MSYSARDPFATIEDEDLTFTRIELIADLGLRGAVGFNRLRPETAQSLARGELASLRLAILFLTWHYTLWDHSLSCSDSRHRRHL